MGAHNKISVLIVDDSRIFRGFVEDSLKNEADIEVIGSVRNGIKALEFINKKKPDVVTLDVEMPDMDGLETLKQIQRINKTIEGTPIGVVMLSAFTKDGAKATIQALEQGAFDFITKPDSDNTEENLKFLQYQLCLKIRSCKTHCFSRKKIDRSLKVAPTLQPKPARTVRKSPFEVILIGVSTGGPQALASLLPKLCHITDCPIIIVQHMPETFTESLAKNLNKKCDHTVLEAFPDHIIQPKHIYIAPGGRHLILKKKNGDVVTANNRQPTENGCRPAVDVLFRSASTLFPKGILALILTGMGNDGTKGLGVLKRCGAYVIAQDEKSSVVWGMPGNAVEADVVDEIKSLEDIPKAVLNLIK